MPSWKLASHSVNHSVHVQSLQELGKCLGLVSFPLRILFICKAPHALIMGAHQ
jgi:hypothetical protein